MKKTDKLTFDGQKQAEQIMQTSLQLLPLIMNNIPQAVFWKNRDLVYLGCNQAFADDAGFSSPEEIIGKTDFDMPWKEQAELYRTDDRLVMEKGEPKLNYEEPQTTPNGSTIWLSTSKIPVHENGKIVAVLGMYEDITERKQAEALLQSMVENAPEAIGIVDLSTGLFSDPNENAVKLYSLPREELVKVGPADMSPPVQPDGRSSTEKAMEKINAAMQGETQVFEWTHRNARGEDIPCEVRLVRLPGDLPRVRFTVTDITEHKKAEQALRDSQRLLQTVMDNIPQSIFWKDSNLTYLGCNSAFAADAGLTSPSNVIGKTDWDMPWKEQAELYRGDDSLVMKSGKSKLNYEEPQTTPDGSTIWLRTSKVPLHDVDGSVSAVLGMYEDITERKQVEQALSDSEARYSAVVTQAKDGVVIIQDNILQFVNQAMADMVGYTPAEIENTPIINYIAPESRTLIVDRIKARLAGQEVPSVYEAKLQRKDGTIFDAELSAGLIEYRGKPADVGMIRDITERKKSEEIIRESEERFRRFTEATAEGLVFHEQGRIIDANPAALVMFGLSNSAEFVGKNLLEFLVPESHEMVLKQMQLETVSPYEVRCIRKNGSTFPVETSTRTYKFGDRTIRATSVRDITERKQAEQALRESQQLLQTVMDNIPQSIFWKDSNLTYLGCNSAFAADAGLASPSDAIGKTDWDMPWKEQAELYRADDSLVMKSGTPKLNYEEPQTTPDGSVIWLRTSKVPLRDMDGKVSAVLGMYEDVTERKQAEQALRESQQLLQTVMDNIPQSIFWKDSNLTYLGCNSAFAADANLASPGDVIGKTDWDMPWKEQAELYRGDDSLVMKSGTPKLNYEEPQTTADGSTIWLRTSKVPLHDVDGSVYAVLGMYEDITERKNLEQQIQTAFERRGRQVQLSTQVSQSIAAASSLEELYQRVVTQVKEQFGYYHTQILRYDAAQDAVVLVTGYGETGAKMLAAGHRLPMGAGLIGTAAASGQTVLRPALENDPDWHSNPLLPNTKGEIAVPIKLGDNILGVLDVQSDVIGALGADDQLLLEGLCGQIATVIESTRLRQEMAERLEEINRLYKAMSHEGWQTYRERADIPKSFMFDQGGLKQATDTGLTEELFAKVPLTVPGGEVIGTLAVADDPQHPISSEDQTFIQQISEQVALALESARLFEQTQGALSEAARKASELETVAEVSATTSTALDPDKLLQSVVDLTKDRFDLYHAHIYLADDKWQVLLIAAGAGEVGRRMVADEHTIPMDAEKSLVARAVRERQAVIVNDVRSSPDFLANPLLPETRSEMAVPMIVGDTVLGVFDVQSDRVDGFTKEDASIYTTLASQVAVALQNARLYEKQAATVAQLRELDSLKSSFLANMSHELRTPLNSILGFADVMLEELDGPLTELMDNDLRLIQKNGQHLLHLINDVLDMAKIDAGRMNLHPEQFNLQELIEDVFSITSSLANEKSLALTIEEDSNPDVEIFADRTRIQQVMINLVNNAIKFTPAGSVTIHVAHQDEKVNIRVSDTGIGIPANHLDRIFQEFAQVDTSTTRKAGGTGLGLPISRRLIEMHGGRLWAESSGVPGEGSTFHIELPVKAKITEPVEKVEK